MAGTNEDADQGFELVENGDDRFDEDIDSFDQDDEDDLDDDDLDDEDDDDDLEDATADDIDFVVAAYREDGAPVVVPLPLELANDLDEMIAQLRRLPGDTGALGAASIMGEFFVLVKVRGRQVEVLLSDALSATDWPLARDVADYLGEDVGDEDDDDDEAYPLGDLGIFADLGVSEMAMEALVEEAEDASDEALVHLFELLKFGAQLDQARKAQERFH